MYTTMFRVATPGLVFVSVVTGGAFATGREIVHFFAQHGSAGWWGVLVAFCCFAVLLFLTAESARTFSAFDYRRWAKAILPGRSWLILDALFVAMAILVAAIVISAAATLASELAIVPALAGGGIFIVVSASIIGGGRRMVVTLKSAGALLLIVTYCGAALTLWTLNGYPTLSSVAGSDGWWRHGLEYVGYNTVALPAMLYALRGLRSRRESAVAGMLAAILMMLPIACLMLAIGAGGVGAIASPLPLHAALLTQGSEALLAMYYLVFFWTLVDTAVGMVFAFLDRVDGHLEDAGRQRLTRAQRAWLCAAFLAGSIGLSTVGLVDLIARGYVLMAYLFIVVLVIPLVVFGIRASLSTWRSRSVAAVGAQP